MLPLRAWSLVAGCRQHGDAGLLGELLGHLEVAIDLVGEATLGQVAGHHHETWRWIQGSDLPQHSLQVGLASGGADMGIRDLYEPKRPSLGRRLLRNCRRAAQPGQDETRGEWDRQRPPHRFASPLGAGQPTALANAPTNVSTAALAWSLLQVKLLMRMLNTSGAAAGSGRGT
jgi:hypothetical protein